MGSLFIFQPDLLTFVPSAAGEFWKKYPPFHNKFIMNTVDNPWNANCTDRTKTLSTRGRQLLHGLLPDT